MKPRARPHRLTEGERVVAETVNIIIVEDDDGHATLVERNLRRAGLNNPIMRLRDGQEAVDYFFAAGCERNAADCVLLLDINMPKIDGINVLRRLKAEPRTSLIPTIMLTTTDDPREINRCYELGCNVYITKPVEYEAFIEAIRRLGFFLQIVRIASNGTRRA
jgi:CheY-like chemotaxis protein